MGTASERFWLISTNTLQVQYKIACGGTFKFSQTGSTDNKCHKQVFLAASDGWNGTEVRGGGTANQYDNGSRATLKTHI
jgi:hypothetical protein